MLKQFAEKYVWACSILKVGLFAIGISKGGLFKIIQGSSAKAAATEHVHVNDNAREIPYGGVFIVSNNPCACKSFRHVADAPLTCRTLG